MNMIAIKATGKMKSHLLFFKTDRLLSIRLFIHEKAPANQAEAINQLHEYFNEVSHKFHPSKKRNPKWNT